MIGVENIRFCKGSNRFGTCNSCGISNEETELFRIRTETELGQGSSICLCEHCAKRLIQSLKSVVLGEIE